jgi:hypothetical protein
VGTFPPNEAATKLIWLALRNITAKWARGPQHWKPAMRQFAILYDDRLLARQTQIPPRMDAAGAVDAQNAPTVP